MNIIYHNLRYILQYFQLNENDKMKGEMDMCTCWIPQHGQASTHTLNKCQMSFDKCFHCEWKIIRKNSNNRMRDIKRKREKKLKLVYSICQT